MRNTSRNAFPVLSGRRSGGGGGGGGKGGGGGGGGGGGESGGGGDRAAGANGGRAGNGRRSRDEEEEAAAGDGPTARDGGSGHFGRGDATGGVLGIIRRDDILKALVHAATTYAQSSSTPHASRQPSALDADPSLGPRPVASDPLRPWTRPSVDELARAFPSYELSETVDLRPHVSAAAAVTPATTSLRRTSHLFLTMGLRHLLVVEPRPAVVGIISRKDLLYGGQETIAQRRRRVSGDGSDGQGGGEAAEEYDEYDEPMTTTSGKGEGSSSGGGGGGGGGGSSSNSTELQRMDASSRESERKRMQWQRNGGGGSLVRSDSAQAVEARGLEPAEPGGTVCATSDSPTYGTDGQQLRTTAARREIQRRAEAPAPRPRRAVRVNRI